MIQLITLLLCINKRPILAPKLLYQEISDKNSENILIKKQTNFPLKFLKLAEKIFKFTRILNLLFKAEGHSMLDNTRTRSNAHVQQHWAGIAAGLDNSWCCWHGTNTNAAFRRADSINQGPTRGFKPGCPSLVRSFRSLRPVWLSWHDWTDWPDRPYWFTKGTANTSGYKKYSSHQVFWRHSSKGDAMNVFKLKKNFFLVWFRLKKQKIAENKLNSNGKKLGSRRSSTSWRSYQY